MTIDSPAVLGQKLVEAGVVPPNSLTPCSEQEIETLEKQFSVNLPGSYRAFLRVMGKDDGNYLSDCSWTYDSLVTFVSTGFAEYAEMHNFKVEPNWFIFLERDSCYFFFDTALGDDPPVIRWCYDDGFKQVWASFSSWLSDMVNADIQGVIKLRARESALKTAQE